MREINCSNATLVMIALSKNFLSISTKNAIILNQFMRGINHMNVIYVVNNFNSYHPLKNIMSQFTKKINPSSVPHPFYQLWTIFFWDAQLLLDERPCLDSKTLILEVLCLMVEPHFVNTTINIFAYFCFSITILKYKHNFQIYIGLCFN